MGGPLTYNSGILEGAGRICCDHVERLHEAWAGVENVDSCFDSSPHKDRLHIVLLAAVAALIFWASQKSVLNLRLLSLVPWV